MWRHLYRHPASSHVVGHYNGDYSRIWDYAPVTPGDEWLQFSMFTGIALYGLLTATLSQLIWAKIRKYGKNERGDVDSNEMIERLERLADMRRDGWLTPRVHDAKKSVLTGKMPGGTRREISSHVPIPRDERKARERLRVGFLNEEE